jgi:hypothetical protein
VLMPKENKGFSGKESLDKEINNILKKLKWGN